MKSLLLLIFFSSFYFTDVAAQKRKAFKINPGEKVVEKIPKDEMYTYSGFIEGTVYFRNNSLIVVLLNYNSLFAEMQFIDLKGDTLSLDNEGTIKLIVIKTDTFYFSNGYQKLIYDQGSVKLAKKTFFSFNNREKLDGLGGSSSGGIETYSAMSGRSYLKELVAMEIITFIKNNIFYIGDRFNNFNPATKKNVLNLYANKEKEVQIYLKENKTDFSNEEDIKKLMTHFKEAD